MGLSKISIVLICTALAIPPAASDTVIQLRGSGTMLALGQRLTDWYARKHTGVQFQIAALDPASSFAAMAGGRFEIVQSTRRVLSPEKEALRVKQGKAYVEVQVATEVAGIAVNLANPVKQLSLFQLRAVLSGSVKNWKQMGGQDAPISLYGRDNSSGVRELLEDEFMGDQEISPSAKTFPGNSAMVAAVSRDVNGIGFGGVETRPEAGVRFLSIQASSAAEGISPTGDAIRANRYKLARPLYFYFAGPPKGPLLEFAEWVLSPEGQLVVESVGYFPLNSADREAGKRALSAP